MTPPNTPPTQTATPAVLSASSVSDHPKGMRTLTPLIILLLITAGTAMQPISTDLYLPSLPGIERYFGISKSHVQWTLSVFVMVFGLSQLVVGPLADRFGRYPTMVAGAGCYALGSMVCLLAPSITVLVFGRALQAVGACAGLVGSRAMVRDLFNPQDGAKMLAKSGSLMSLVPMLGPILAGWLELRFGWRASFAVLTCFGVLMLAFVLLYSRETNPFKDPTATAPLKLMRSYWQIARTPSFLAYVGCTSFSYGGLFAFISGSSFVFIQIFKLTPTLYGFIFGAVGFSYMVGTQICRKLLPRMGYQRVLMAATVWTCACATAMLGLILLGVIHPLALMIPMMGYVLGHGLVNPCTQAGAIAPFAHMAGTATALAGLIIMLVASLVGLWIGASFNGTVLPLTATIFACSVVLLLCGQVLVRRFGLAPTS